MFPNTHCARYHSMEPLQVLTKMRPQRKQLQRLENSQGRKGCPEEPHPDNRTYQQCPPQAWHALLQAFRGHLSRHAHLISPQDSTIFHQRKCTATRVTHTGLGIPRQDRSLELLFQVPNGLVIVLMAFWWSAKCSVAHYCFPVASEPISGQSILSHHPHQPLHPHPMSRAPGGTNPCRETRQEGPHMNF